MSDEKKSDEIPVEVISENETDSSNAKESENVNNNDHNSEDLSKLLESLWFLEITSTGISSDFFSSDNLNTIIF